jgi:membrane-bound lytic murein transglycosylase B
VEVGNMSVRWVAAVAIIVALASARADAAISHKKPAAPHGRPRAPHTAVRPLPPVRSDWEYLVLKLSGDGVARERARAIFDDPRIGPFGGLEFSLYRGESRAMYGGFLRPASIAQAQQCRALYDQEFRTAEERFGVPASVVAALLHVETHCGRNTGRQLVFARLARLAMANEPSNVARNLALHRRGVPAGESAAVDRLVRERAKEIEGIFYPEVLAMFRMAERTGIDPLDVRGSGSGAFGMPQFLPSSYLRFGVDADGDGRISLYEPADAIASAANYLAHHGWRRGLTHAEQRQVIWAYNHSDPYIDTVLALAVQLERAQPSRLSLAER